MKKAKILFSLILLSLAFIWINSLLPSEQSGNLSAFFQRILNRIFMGHLVFSEHMVRKIAHAAEFSVLGAATALFMEERIYKHISFVLLCGIGAAVCDETIQLFSDGRSSQIKDVWIDFGGYAFGVIFICVLLRFIEIIKKKK